MTWVSKNVYIDKLADMVNKYDISQSIDVKSSTNIDFNKKNNKEDPKFEVGDQVRIQKYKNVFGISYTPNWSEEVFVIKKLKTLCCGQTSLVILTRKKLSEHLKKRKCKQQLKKSLGFKK